MPLDRFLHAAAGHSDKANKLTDFEYRVWTQYLLSADDFGVMRFGPAKLQADNDRLETASVRQVQRALATVVAVGLVAVFEHQGKSYVFQEDWQTWQKVEYPSRTTLPKPPQVDTACDLPTRLLFTVHPGGERAPKLPKGFDKDSPISEQEFAALAGAGARMATATAMADGNGSGEENARETSAVVPIRRGYGAGALAGSLPRDHVKHSWCGERICVHASQHADFIRRAGGDPADANRRLREIYQRAHDAIPDGPFGDDVFDFWRAAVAAEFPTVAPKPKAAAAGRTGAPDADKYSHLG